ncbi:MAG: exodeoxyribonuclease VII large subunit, partial [Acidimicrobiales bacterium]
LWERINAALAPIVGQRIRVRTTIASFKLSRDGHAFFDLVSAVDQGGTSKRVTAMLPGVIWATSYRRIAAVLDREGLGRLGNDLELILVGKLVATARYGRIQFQVEDVDVRALRVDALIKLETIREKLRAEGVWTLNRSLVVTEVPLRIALVTSSAGAVKSDFLRPIEASPYRISVDFFPTGVAGEAALVEIPHALGRASQGDYDVIVLVRGGGSAADLSTFNEEVVVRAVASCDLPVWVAIGHSTDRGSVLVDEVANRAFDVPQSIGTCIVDLARSFLDEADAIARRAMRAAELRLREETISLTRSLPSLVNSVHQSLGRQAVTIDSTLARLHRRSADELASSLRGIEYLRSRIHAASRHAVAQRFEMVPSSELYRIRRAADHAFRLRIDVIANLERAVSGIDIDAVLAQGFVAVISEEGYWVRDGAGIGPGAPLELVFRDARRAVSVTDGGGAESLSTSGEGE